MPQFRKVSGLLADRLEKDAQILGKENAAGIPPAGPDGREPPTPATIREYPATGRCGRPGSRRHLPRRDHSGNTRHIPLLYGPHSSGKPSSRSFPGISYMASCGGTCRASGFFFSTPAAHRKKALAVQQSGGTSLLRNSKTPSSHQTWSGRRNFSSICRTSSRSVSRCLIQAGFVRKPPPTGLHVSLFPAHGRD